MREYAVGDEPVTGYRIVRQLGAGESATVWVAHNPGGIEVALKISSLPRQGIKEFQAIGVVKRLGHPNLIPIYAFWLKDEFGNCLDSTAPDSVNLRGRSSELIVAYGLGDKSLAQRLDECKKAFAERHNLPDTGASLLVRLHELGGTELAGLPPEELFHYMFEAAQAIDYLNQPMNGPGDRPAAAILHCNIKPSNLLIVGHDIQLCDYGLALASPEGPDLAAGRAPAYVAPEVIANRPTRGTDQYSLAIVYYQARTGRLPFEESAAFHAHVLGQLDFGLATPIEQEVLRRATHMRPDLRFPHALEMVQALKRAVVPSRQYKAAPRRAGLDELIQAGVELVPGHRLERLLSRGGYGEVWAATMPGKTRCALKIVRPLDAVQGLQELKSLQKIRNLDHDRLIRLQSYWFLANDGSIIPDEKVGQPGTPPAAALVVATELAEKNLLQRWQECVDQGHVGIPFAELLTYTGQAAEAIDHLNFHKPAIIHRDIKPEHILLSRKSHVKVGGFELVKFVEGTTATVNWASVGLTLAYAAPEMFRNTVTKWTDQYSLALTYYRLRTGRLPFEDGLGPIQMMQAHTSGGLDLSGIGPKEQVVLKRACAVEPRSRFASCTEFAEALSIAADEMPPARVAAPATPRRQSPAQPSPEKSLIPSRPAARFANGATLAESIAAGRALPYGLKETTIDLPSPTDPQACMPPPSPALLRAATGDGSVPEVSGVRRSGGRRLWLVGLLLLVAAVAAVAVFGLI